MKISKKTILSNFRDSPSIPGCFFWYTTTRSNEYGNELIKDIPKLELREEEITGLIQMREEEKLARDVYKTLGAKWGLKILTNIAESEQTHTDAVKVLLDRYDLEDPVKDDSIGAFTSPIIDELYNDLVYQGNKSLLDALIVGATVEDLDINDLNELLAETDNQDITAVYNNLNKGSRNHLHAFVAQIENRGGSYSPQYISQTEFNTIISSEQERARARRNLSNDNSRLRGFQIISNSCNEITHQPIPHFFICPKLMGSFKIGKA